MVVFNLVKFGREGLDLVEVLGVQVPLVELDDFGNGLVYWSLGLGDYGWFGLWHLVELGKDLDLIGENTVVYKMPRKVKNPCSSTLPLDVLSNLPAHVLDDILICLPFRDAVRTSILSNKWRFNWCRLPALMLDQTLWDTTNENINFVTRFTDIIYHIMAFHVGPITKFTLSIADMENYLVSFLSRNGSVDIAAKLSSPLNCLKSLCLSDICLDESVELFVALCLIRSSPYLQDIQMKFDYSDELFFPLSGDVTWGP
ncbi:hypothetical protein BC332_27419 [Capsicum chinense]|nr:hypothetical protein BC332_27419 [Capsicum chinense]